MNSLIVRKIVLESPCFAIQVCVKLLILQKSRRKLSQLFNSKEMQVPSILDLDHHWISDKSKY